MARVCCGVSSTHARRHSHFSFDFGCGITVLHIQLRNAPKVEQAFQVPVLCVHKRSKSRSLAASTWTSCRRAVAVLGIRVRQLWRMPSGGREASPERACSDQSEPDQSDGSVAVTVPAVSETTEGEPTGTGEEEERRRSWWTGDDEEGNRRDESESNATQNDVHGLPLAQTPNTASANSAGPLPVFRQNASSFRWPPDPRQGWCYIDLPPEEFALRCQRVHTAVTAREIAMFFSDLDDTDSRAYRAYATKYRLQIDALLQAPATEARRRMRN